MQSRGKKNICSTVLIPGSDDTISERSSKNRSSASTSNTLNSEIGIHRTNLYRINILNTKYIYYIIKL